MSRVGWTIGFVASLLLGFLLRQLKLGPVVAAVFIPQPSTDQQVAQGAMISGLITALLMIGPAVAWCMVYGWKPRPSRKKVELNERLASGAICGRCHHSFRTDERKVPYEGRFLCGTCAKTLSINPGN